MTEKQIIIDVSKCEWRTGVEHCGAYECMLNKCCDYNCDWYKRRKLEQQLKAKEEECKALREEKAYTDMACKQFEEQLDQLKSENEELKKYEYYYLDKFLKIKDCLTEIKEIVENEMTQNGDTYIILQKISEVEDGR